MNGTPKTMREAIANGLVYGTIQQLDGVTAAVRDKLAQVIGAELLGATSQKDKAILQRIWMACGYPPLPSEDPRPVCWGCGYEVSGTYRQPDGTALCNPCVGKSNIRTYLDAKKAEAK